MSTQERPCLRSEMRLVKISEMKICCLTITAALLFTFLPFLTIAGGPDPQNIEYVANFQNIDEMLFKGENQQALEILERFPENDLDSVERLWRLSRVQYEMGRLDEKKAPKLFRKSEQYARAAIAENPDSSDSYKWLAIALGAQAKYSDTKTQVDQSREIKESIEKSIALNPDDDISYLVLSRWHYKVSGLGTVARTFAKIIYGGVPKASLKKAEELLLQAIALHDRISHRYNLAKVYDRMERYEDKKIQLQKALLLPVTFPEELEEQEKAREKLQG